MGCKHHRFIKNIRFLESIHNFELNNKKQKKKIISLTNFQFKLQVFYILFCAQQNVQNVKCYETFDKSNWTPYYAYE